MEYVVAIRPLDTVSSTLVSIGKPAVTVNFLESEDKPGLRL